MVSITGEQQEVRDEALRLGVIEAEMEELEADFAAVCQAGLRQDLELAAAEQAELDRVATNQFPKRLAANRRRIDPRGIRRITGPAGRFCASCSAKFMSHALRVRPAAAAFAPSSAACRSGKSMVTV